MRVLLVVGIALIVIGIIAIAYGGLSFTSSEKVAEVGPLKLEKEHTRTIALPPVLGVVALVGGVVLVVVGARRR